MSSQPRVTTIRVATAAPYDVLVGRGLLERVGGLVGARAERVAVVHPAPLASVADRVVAALGDRAVLRLPIPDGEAAKTVEVAAAAWEALGAAGFTRSDAVVTVGGGATTDMGGFIAATWLRGVPVVHVPTTLLAMVDAAIGGKTGMNSPAGKNLIGAFHEPAGVLCDLDLLATLPPAELVAGLGEVIKAGFIADPTILTIVEADPAAVLEPTGPALRELIERAIRVKADVVAGDLTETGGSDERPGREVLNYGHTLAHAIEKVTNYRVRHGEAVAIGMVFVAALAHARGDIDEGLLLRHEGVLRAVGLPVRWHGEVGFDRLMEVMRVDKKARGSVLRLVSLAGATNPIVVTDPDPDLLRRAWERVSTGTGADG